MNRRYFRVVVVALAAWLLFGPDAAAWGWRARRAIAVSAIQMVRKEHSDVFRAEETSYEEDVLRGAEAGAEILKTQVPLQNDTEAISAVSDQVQLLREVRKAGRGSYFAFRMGVLSALVADLIMPYGMVWSASDAQLRVQIESDIDAALEGYSFIPSSLDPEYVRDARAYFSSARKFYAENKRMIASDYATGKGYSGFLSNGGEAYFGDAIEAVTDLWCTVLRIEGDPSDAVPSPVTVATYHVNEIAYLLTEKRNPKQAQAAYDRFSAANPGLPELYEQIGDLFYGYGTRETQDRAVREWRIAYTQGGPERVRVGGKLAAHYIHVGEACLDRASKPAASDKELPDAREAFSLALEFDRSSVVAEDALNKTNIAIQEREQRRQLAVNIIASGEKVMKEAERYRMNKEPGSLANAIATYKQAGALFEAVDDEFPDQAKAAKESIKSANKSVGDAIIEILEMATAAISSGDSAVSEHRWDDAFAKYDSVPNIVSVIPDDDATHSRHKKEVVDEAARKRQEGETSKKRFEDATRAAVAATAPGGAAAGTAPAAAPAGAAPGPKIDLGGGSAPAGGRRGGRSRE